MGSDTGQVRVLELELNCDILQKLFEIKIDHLDTFDEDSNGFEASTKACLDIVDSDTREAAQVNVYPESFGNDYDDESNDATNENDHDDIVFYDNFVIHIFVDFFNPQLQIYLGME